MYLDIKLRFEKTRISNNINSILKYQKIYTELVNNDVPLLKDKGRKKKVRMLAMARNGIMVSGVVFFLMYSRVGMLNRLLIALISTNLMIFVTKGYFYSKIVEDSAEELSLTGQETRIQLR